MNSEEKYKKFFTAGGKLSKDLIQLDGIEPKKIGFFEKRKLKKAKKYFELSSNESPGNAAPFLMLSKVSFSLGNQSESLSYLLKAWDLEPANLILVIELSGVYGVLGKHKEAISVLEEGIKYYPKEPRVLFNLGLAYLLENRAKEAVDIFRTTVDIEPEFKQNHSLLKYSMDVLSGKRPVPKTQSEIARYI